MQESFLEQKVFLNTELKPYNALTREEKHILLDALIDDNIEEYGCFWDKLSGDLFYTHSIYRTKPKEYKKLNIPWQVIDEKWKYAAMSEGGWVGFYEKKPKWKIYSSNEWNVDSNNVGDAIEANCLKLDTTGIVAEHSLTTRPEGV